MHRSIRGAIVAAATAVATLVPFAGIASASSVPQPKAAYAGGFVFTNGDVAIVPVSYKCTSVVSPGNHLFVAVKQGRDVSPTNTSSGSAHLTTFLSTNWNSDSGPNALSCDGRRHVQDIIVAPQPGFDGKPLANGRVLVQICLYDNVTGFNGEEPVGGFAASYTIQRAVNAFVPAGGIN